MLNTADNRSWVTTFSHSYINDYAVKYIDSPHLPFAGKSFRFRISTGAYLFHFRLVTHAQPMSQHQQEQQQQQQHLELRSSCMSVRVSCVHSQGRLSRTRARACIDPCRAIPRARATNQRVITSSISRFRTFNVPRSDAGRNDESRERKTEVKCVTG